MVEESVLLRAEAGPFMSIMPNPDITGLTPETSTGGRSRAGKYRGDRLRIGRVVGSGIKRNELTVSS
jgi:hypothetical protein